MVNHHVRSGHRSGLAAAAVLQKREVWGFDRSLGLWGGYGLEYFPTQMHLPADSWGDHVLPCGPAGGASWRAVIPARMR